MMTTVARLSTKSEFAYDSGRSVSTKKVHLFDFASPNLASYGLLCMLCSLRF